MGAKPYIIKNVLITSSFLEKDIYMSNVKFFLFHLSVFYLLLLSVSKHILYIDIIVKICYIVINLPVKHLKFTVFIPI